MIMIYGTCILKLSYLLPYVIKRRTVEKKKAGKMGKREVGAKCDIHSIYKDYLFYLLLILVGKGFF